MGLVLSGRNKEGCGSARISLPLLGGMRNDTIGNMKVSKWIPPVFYAATAYDGILGLIGLLIPVQLYAKFDVPLPGHMGYIYFLSLLMILVAVMFFNIARDAQANKNLIFYGILAKTSFCLVVFGYLLFGSIPALFVPFAFLDLIFLALFVIADRAIE